MKPNPEQVSELLELCDLSEGGGDWLSTGRAAKLCSVTSDAVLKWIRSGRLPARRTAGGHFRVRRTDVARLQAGREDRRPLYCFEFHATDGVPPATCRDCGVYRVRALRCFDLRDFVGDEDLRRICEGTCADCDYFLASVGAAGPGDLPEVR